MTAFFDIIPKLGDYLKWGPAGYALALLVLGAILLLYLIRTGNVPNFSAKLFGVIIFMLFSVAFLVIGLWLPSRTGQQENKLTVHMAPQGMPDRETNPRIDFRDETRVENGSAILMIRPDDQMTIEFTELAIRFSQQAHELEYLRKNLQDLGKVQPAR